MTDPGSIDEDPRLAALLDWRAGLVRSGLVSAGSFKEAHIRLVLRSGRTDVERIRAMLPGPVAEHAEELARLLQETTSPAVATLPGRGGRHGKPDLADDAQILATPDQRSAPRSGFAPYEVTGSEHRPEPISLRRADDGTAGLEVSWPAYTATGEPADRYLVYRLVSTETDRGYSPDNGHLVASTRATSAIDDRPAVSAVRHLQVWVNAGSSQANAFAAQPVLHAAGVVIGAPHGVDIREDSGRVVGQWPAIPGVTAVHVYRIPPEQAGRGGPAFRIAADSANLTGFIDHDAERGRHYVYRVRCEVEVDGVVRLSEAVDTEIAVSAVLEPVADLALTMHGDRGGTVFDLQWTAPRVGRVLVFRTPAAASADAHSFDLDESVLGQVGLPSDAQLVHPVEERTDEHGTRKSSMIGVPWPKDWSRAYFTPVTVVDGRARLGESISSVRTGWVTDVALLEYCNKQVLTFGWPEGAASVVVYLAPKGHDPRRGLSGRSYEIALADYEKYGGMQFVGTLPSRGCSLHLVPVAFSGGRPVRGLPTSIEYDGLLRLWYDVRVGRDPVGAPISAAVCVRAEGETAGSPPFVLINNSERIPLSATDGTAVDVARVDPDGHPITGRSKEFQLSNTASGNETWNGDVRGLRGWIRLFANLPPNRLRLLALLDPSIDALMLTPGTIPR